MKKITPVDRFLRKFVISADDECWRWTAHISRNGYGRQRVNGKNVSAHRFAYEIFVGPISEGLELDHLCRIRHCVNPLHLEPVTHTENVRRGEGGANMRAKTHCPADHAYTPENTYLYKGKKRRCRACDASKQAARKKKEDSRDN